MQRKIGNDIKLEKTVLMMIDWVVDGCVMWHTGDVNLIPNFIGLKALNKQKMT